MPSAIDLAYLESQIADVAPMAWVEAVTKNSMLFQTLQKRPPSDPKGPTWQAELEENASTSSFAVGGVLPSPGARENVQAQLGWGNYVGSFSVPDRYVRQFLSADSMGVSKFANELGGQMMSTMRTMATDIEADILTGSTDNETIIGLATAIDPTATYAGIAPGTYSNWASYENDNSGTPRSLTAALMNTTYNELVQVRGGKCSVILCGYAQWEAAAALTAGGTVLSTQANFDTGSPPAGASKFVGFSQLFFKGTIPVIAVPGFTTGEMIFVDEDYLYLEELAPIGPPVNIPGSPAIEREGDLFKFLLFGYYQLVMENRRKAGARLKDLS